MSEHTKEPWTLGKGDVSVREDSGRKRFICRTHIPGDNRPMPREEQAANAARIVACVNACAAIPTADLATGVVPIAEYNRIKALLAEQDEFRRDGYDVLASACADEATGVVPAEVVRRLVEAGNVLLGSVYESQDFTERDMLALQSAIAAAEQFTRKADQ